MTKHIILTAVLYCALAPNPVHAQTTKQGTATEAKNDVKFLEDISVDPAPVRTTTSDPRSGFSESLFTTKKAAPAPVPAVSIEQASTLQFKFALLLDQEVEQVLNLGLFRVIDEWLGTRYRLGGSTREGIDCSAFMQVLFTTVYNISLPRTAREQYAFARKITRGELREGDLVFFNTVGGVSHVGMYLQNNKFVHASSGGVTISDLYEEYWVKHFVGVGRIDPPSAPVALTTVKP